MLKRSAGWATNFKRKPFLAARLKLTAFYTLAMFLVLVVFNLLVFGLFITDVPEEMEAALPQAEQAEERLERVLYLADSFILVLVAPLSYLLAGLALKPIERAYEQQKKFVADAAHELRTPLTVMKTGAEATLRGEVAAGDERTFIQDALGEVNHLSQIVDELLVLARGDAGRSSQTSKVNFSQLLAYQMSFMEAYARQKGVAMQQRIEEEIYVHGNHDDLKRLVANLIGNAIDHNKPHGSVTISLTHQGRGALLTVSDTGMGIAESDLPFIFDRFFKADVARGRQGGGSGLGLPIAKQIVESHGGVIQVESEAGKGTVVSVQFPERA